MGAIFYPHFTNSLPHPARTITIAWLYLILNKIIGQSAYLGGLPENHSNSEKEVFTMMYKTIVIDDAPKKMAAAIEKTANKKAKDGWKLLTFSVSASGKAILLFEVPEEEAEKEPVQEDEIQKDTIRKDGIQEETAEAVSIEE